ncbi:hypothetical protein BCR39DRAFT_342552 [Naematelia encephala]|uniref:Uncharacterized protein n=1 Tax=Naematelia encephala TaxID=71784 RepID=A0A1Y2AML9_9TREE|nr:hypothetical protein BCR39DRAFT_342552 [Naematelia encephala]
MLSNMARTFLDLPREVIRNIALHIYDPLYLTQQDRLTWGIFSTVDMHQERQDDLASLVSFGSSCRRARREVRVVLFRCIRTPTVNHVEEVIRNRRGWAKYVRSVIVDLTMFDSEDTIMPRPRSCWAESTLLINLLSSLPALEHLCFFADASDDSTAALMWASLIPHPSLHPIPPPTDPSSPSPLDDEPRHIPLAHRLRSFSWRQRATPPTGFHQFSQSSTFVSTVHLLRHAYRLSFLVLDADLDEMNKDDVLVAVRELDLRQVPVGEMAEKVSLMLCGPITGWGKAFLEELVLAGPLLKELFIDRPLGKTSARNVIAVDELSTLLSPVSNLVHLTLLQVGSYFFSHEQQEEIAWHLSSTIPSLLVLGLLGDEGETNWWGIRRIAPGERSIRPLADGDLLLLEREAGVVYSRRATLIPVEANTGGNGLVPMEVDNTSFQGI